MMHSRDPVRWADAADAPTELAAAIRALRASRGSADQVEALARRLAPQLAAPTLGGSGVGISTWLKGGALLLSGLLGFYALSKLGPAEPPAPARPTAQPAAAMEAEPAPAPTVALQVPPAPAIEPRPTRAPAKPRSASATHPTAAPTSAPERELLLVQRSQAALDRDPLAALSLAEEHARDYPQGVFAQEREILALEALLKLRRRPEALARAELFLQRYPESPHSRRVRALLERSRALVPATIQEGTAHPMDGPADVPVPSGGGHEQN